MATRIDATEPPQPRTQDPADSGDSLVLSQKGLRSTAISDRETLLCGRRAFERGADDEALESLSRLTEHGKEYADVHYMIGMVRERQGDLEAAVESLRRATRINPSYVEALVALASLHERRGDFDLSESYAERARQLCQTQGGGLDPTTRGKLANQQAELADALALVGERREAIEEYRRALDRCPEFHDIRHRLGVTLREAGLPYQAAREFERILSVHPGLLDSQIQLGLTLYSLGRTPDAVRVWEAVLERDPGRHEARMYLRLVRGAGERSPAAPAAEGWQTREIGRRSASAEADEGESGNGDSKVAPPAPTREVTP